MALFRSALLYGASPEPCTGPAEQPGGLPRLMSTLRRSHRPLLQTAAAKCSTNVTCFNKCSQTANAKAKPTGTAAVSQTSARKQYIQTCYHDTGQNVSLSADNQHAVRRLAAQSISTSLGLNVSRVTGVIFLSVKSLRSSSAFQTEATTRSVSELNVWPAIMHSQTIRVQMNELWSSRLAKYWISTSAGVTMSM